MRWRNLKFRLLVGAALLLAACSTDPGMVNGPRLVQDVTLAPTTPAPTRELSPTPSPIVIPVTSEFMSPLEVVTVQSALVLVTPTLPPSKTSTATPTITPTVTPTYTPTVTSPPTSTVPPTQPPQPVQAVVYPTAIPQQQPPPPAPVANPAGASCGTRWFFNTSQPPSGCPSGSAEISRGSFQQFQNGYMFWVAGQQSIYVLYTSAGQPRWEVFTDTYTDDIPEYDPSLGAGPPYTWQPRRGFGLIWRNNATVRDRLGWAVSEWEFEYEVSYQSGQDGTLWVNQPRGGVFALYPNGREWAQFQ